MIALDPAMRHANAIAQETALVLTASVDPKGMPGQARHDPFLREVDYTRGLEFYLRRYPTLKKLVFIENSGWPLDRFREVARIANPHQKGVEFISLNCNDFPREKGKGYGELLLLDLGLAESRYARESVYWAKITGRNYLLNLMQILDTLRQPFEFACDMKDHCVYDVLHQLRLMRLQCGHHADTRFFITKPRFYDVQFRHLHRIVDESKFVFMEAQFCTVMKRPDVRPCVISRFCIEPDYRGFAGWQNTNYGGFRNRLKCSIRSATRRLFPWLHI